VIELIHLCTMLLAAPPVKPPVPPTPPPVPAPAPITESVPAAIGAENTPIQGEMTEELHTGIANGLTYLVAQQNENGSFGQGRFNNHVGITALAAIALLADGNMSGRGEYSEAVDRALDFILNNATKTGLIAGESAHGPMYGHGFSTLFLGELYGMSNRDGEIRPALERAVDLIVRTQNDEGGWRYQPIPSDADVSVTICEIMALRSARNAGIKVPESTIEKAVQYVRQCQNSDGGWRYMLRTGTSAWPRTAAGVSSLYYAGIHEGESITKGLEYLNERAMPGGANVTQSHYFYGQYYAVQAMYMAGGEYWERWWPAIREELLRRQASNGGWIDHQVGGAYATSMALIILQMPKRYLPIFQR
jgi:hypothetical protein